MCDNAQPVCHRLVTQVYKPPSNYTDTSVYFSMTTQSHQTEAPRSAAFFRLEGTLVTRPTLAAAAWLAGNAQGLGERLARLGNVALAAPIALRGELSTGVTSSRLTWMGLRGMSEDRVTVLAAEYVDEFLGGELLEVGVRLVKEARRQGRRVVLISDGGANAGITDLDLIASEAGDADGGGTYLVGVGVGEAAAYSDELMDAVTDAGKGAYVFVDGPAEASKQFGERFLANVAVSARNVRMRLTLPWYFGVKRFHGEEISPDPAEVDPQHLAPNDSMTFHQIIAACDPSLITTCDSIGAHVEYTDPLTGMVGSDEATVGVADLVLEDAPRLYKADVVVGYAKALVVIDGLMSVSNPADAAAVALGMQAWAQEAASALSDPELQEISDLMGEYAGVLSP